MSDSTNFRAERIEKLLNELRYEMTRGIMERDIDESVSYRFIIPSSHSIPDGVVVFNLETRPILMSQLPFMSHDPEPKLRLVK